MLSADIGMMTLGTFMTSDTTPAHFYCVERIFIIWMHEKYLDEYHQRWNDLFAEAHSATMCVLQRKSKRVFIPKYVSHLLRDWSARSKFAIWIVSCGICWWNMRYDILVYIWIAGLEGWSSPTQIDGQTKVWRHSYAISIFPRSVLHIGMVSHSSYKRIQKGDFNFIWISESFFDILLHFTVKHIKLWIISIGNTFNEA